MDGWFETPAATAVENQFNGHSSPRVTAVGDVDGDGKPVVGTANRQTVLVTLGEGK